jgi:hypothetical protein
MLINTRSRFFLALLAWTLPVAVLVPYAFFASEFRVLIWVIQNLYRPFWLLWIFSFAAAGVCSILLYRVNRLGIYVFQAYASIILIQGIVLAMSERRHGLLVILFVLAGAFVGISEWMRRTLKLPFYHSGRRWWESYPKAMPGLSAFVSADNTGSQRTPVRITNLGIDGAYIFSLNGELPFSPKHLEIRGESFFVQCPVRVEVKTRDGFGQGLGFLKEENDGDWQKELQDQMVSLGRSGYVAI